MKSTSSGKGLRSDRARASTPRSATSRRRISASISRRSSSIRALYSSSSSRCSRAVSLRGGPGGAPPWAPPSAWGGVLESALGHEPRQHTVEIEVPERAVEVVRAAHRATGLHARIAADGEPGDRCQHRLIALPQRLVEHGSNYLGRHRLTPTGAVSLAAALSPALAGSGVGVRTLIEGVVLGDVVLRPPHREIDLEGGVECPPVGRGLHERGPEGVLDRLTVLQREVPDRLGGIGCLRDRDRQSRPAELGHPRNPSGHRALAPRTAESRA